jgi:hypothetical protein
MIGVIIGAMMGAMIGVFRNLTCLIRSIVIGTEETITVKNEDGMKMEEHKRWEVWI